MSLQPVLSGVLDTNLPPRVLQYDSPHSDVHILLPLPPAHQKSLLVLFTRIFVASHPRTKHTLSSESPVGNSPGWSTAVFGIPNPAPPKPNGDDDKPQTAPTRPLRSGSCRGKKDPPVTLELAFEDAPIQMREGNDDERVERGAFVRGQWEGKR